MVVLPKAPGNVSWNGSNRQLACIETLTSQLVAFTMMDVKDRVVSFTDNLNEYLMASKKVNDSLIDRLDAILRRLSSFEPEA